MDVLMPQLGETVAEGKVVRWLKAKGDVVKPGDNLFEIETDKATVEVPATGAGVLQEIRVAEGTVAPVGAVVAVIAGDGVAAAPVAAPPPKIAGDPFNVVRTPARNYGPARLPGGAVVTPLARRLAAENGIDLATVEPSGPHGRIVAKDIEAFARRAPAQAARSFHLVADVSLDRLDAILAEIGEAAVTRDDFVIKAWALAVQQPVAFGRAVVRDAATRTLTQIAAARAQPALDGDAASAIVSFGVSGIREVAVPVEPPRTTVLALGAPRRAPVEAEGGGIRFESVMTVTLACDVRALDPARGAELLAVFRRLIERPLAMLA